MLLLLRVVLIAVGLALLIGIGRRVLGSKGRPVTESTLRQRASDLSQLNWFAVLVAYGMFAVAAVAYLEVPDPWPTILGYGGGVLALIYLGSQVIAGWKEGSGGPGH